MVRHFFAMPEPALNAPLNAKPRGRQFFNNPGPTNIPDRVLRAMDRPVMDFMSDEFVAIHELSSRSHPATRCLVVC